jgi:hypothetical protein
VLQHLALAACEAGQLSRVCTPAVLPLYAALLKREGGLDGRAQLDMIERLFKKIHSLRSERGAGGRHVSMSCNDYERQGYSAFPQFILQLNAALPWQPHVRYDTARPVLFPGSEKRFGVSEHRCPITCEPEHEGDGIAHRGVIVNDEYGQAL